MDITLLAVFSVLAVSGSGQSDGSDFLFTNGPVPDTFQLHQRYPDRPETVECRPIRLQIPRGSRRFRTELITNDHSGMRFASADARIMSMRLRRHLNELAESFHDAHAVWLSVSKAWAEEGDRDIDDPASLHFEGRTVRVSVASSLVSLLLQLAIEVGFDWVQYADENFLRLSVIPNLCDASLDMVFMLDRSGSVGKDNFNTAISFLQEVVGFYDISSDATQVGLVSYSTGATIEFDLNDFQSVDQVKQALSQVFYTKGWTATALALGLTRFMMDPLQNYGARPFEDGIPKVAVLLTDGRSNQLPITARANALRNFGVQVYTVGIGDIYLPELKFIASDPDRQHVFLLGSFNDAQSFVDRLSLTTCDTPAVVEPGEDTRTEIEEDEFRFFESRCAAFSDTVMIEQIDLVGKCSLYASWSVQNPGPLDPFHTVVRNEDQTGNRRSLHLTTPLSQDRFVYVSVRGRHRRNEFTIVIWDMIFTEDEYTIKILDDGNTMGQVIINLVDQIRDTNARFRFEIKSGNEEGQFSLDTATGIITAATSLSPGSSSLNIVAQNTQHSCHRAKVVVNVIVMEETLEFNPLPQPISISEATTQGTMVTQISATSSSNTPPTYSIIAGDTLDQFSIDPASGDLSVESPLNFEEMDEYSLTVQARGASSVVMAIQVIEVQDANEPPEFVTECAIAGSCSFSEPEGGSVNMAVGTVVATDPDIRNPSFSMLRYGIESATAVPFSVSDVGEITTTEVLDFESTPSYSFTLTVQDSGSPPSPRIQTQVVVNVEDVPENAPPMFPADCSLGVLENSVAVGEPLINCQASDPDHPDNEIVYEIIGGNVADTFRVDPAMGPGILVTTRPLDREDTDLYTLTLQATDPAQLAATVTFEVRILDVNDSPPSCTAPNPPLLLPTAFPEFPGGTVATFTAPDPDMNPAPAIFSIMSQVIAQNFLSATVVVTATDGEDSSLSSTCSLTVQFQESCERQDYSIVAATGELRVALLCGASVDPPAVTVLVGRSRAISCRVSTNVPFLVQYLQNGTAVTMMLQPFTSFVLLTVDFDDSGEYTCLVTSDLLGSILSSPPTIVEIQIAPEIITAPADVEVDVGQPVEFECVVFGVPEPSITWLGPNSQEVVDTSNPRIQTPSPPGNLLRILNVQLGDTGNYTCRATNPHGTVSVNATLTAFQLQQLVIAEVPQYQLPSQDSSCHEFNSTHFNALLTAITGHTSLTTAQDSNDLCPPSSCNPSPCENEGVCLTETTPPGGFSCECPPQFTGRTCGELIDPCTRTPCRNGGLCGSSSRGEFICSCPDGYHGDRCQYTDVCLNSTPCRENDTCLETVVRREGYVCLAEEGEGEGGKWSGVRVTAENRETAIPTLDGKINSYIETAGAKSKRRRAAMTEDEVMEENGFVTVCEGRFIPSPSSPGVLHLVWACPEGVASPGGDDEEAICVLLIRQRLVTSCISPQGGTLDLQPLTPLPPSRVNITFLLTAPSTGRPLTASDVLVILRETRAKDKLNDTIYRTERFSAVAPSDGSSPPTNRGGVIAGAVLGTLSVIIILAVAIAIVVVVIKRRRTKDDQWNGTGTMDMGTFPNHYVQVPRNEKAPPTPETSLAPLPGNRQSEFDDPVYGAGYGSSGGPAYHPPLTERRSLERGMRSSLERGMKLVRMRSRVPSVRRSDSGENLLNRPSLEDSGDYDDVVAGPLTTPPHVTTPTINGDPDSEIYANIAHQRGGAMGNAGQRWQSYWQTKTLLRTDSADLSRK